MLQATARAITGQTRENDLLFRYGGDEFLLLLPRTDQDRATCLAKRLRDEMAKLTLQGSNGDSFKAEFSIGVIQYRPVLNSLQEMLAKLDESLYRAKRESDRVALAS